MILAIETATQICSVSLLDREGQINEKRIERKGSHSELLFLFVKELMEEHHFNMQELDAVLVSAGPGSYTGLRIAASAVKGMLFDLDVEVYAANTLAGFAQSTASGNVHAVINARRKHLYHQGFTKEDELKSETESDILEIDEINGLLQPGDTIIGTGIQRLNEEILDSLTIMDESNISASNLIHLFKSSSKESYFRQTTPEKLESNYLTSSQVNNSSL